MLKKAFTFLAIALLVVFLVGELVGRYFGLHDYPTHVSSDTFEYIHSPNQDRTIYGNHFITNEFSMRSEPISPEDSLIVLLIGDSVVNGGNLTDHDSLASTLLEKSLSDELGQKVRVLNIAAGSWGPDNGMEYVKKYGLFGADAIVLVFSSHDAHDNIKLERSIVDNHPQYFSKNYPLAWGKLAERGWQQVEGRLFKKNKQNKIDNSDLGISEEKDFNAGFAYFRDVAASENIPLFLYLHASLEELKKQELNDDGLEIVQFSDSNNIQLITELETDLKPADFRDGIHYSDAGQKHLAKELQPLLLDVLE
ncbi:hypothetical protein CLV84_3990 [Neolewinella xylanilytica]|uniref:Lysophospholipase L1-like esterase n=1 Tax=Neolewinella xylanilytica TaxID=1514080 RepID=A0A2S6I029_9BACT|nr:SGNH/GDSL hydrolase family protein [Neolewinella xylanilytica]PPK84222.1 hypothetical protein CLV84_3990 [Neolewinella xylanilytica]